MLVVWCVTADTKVMKVSWLRDPMTWVITQPLHRTPRYYFWKSFPLINTYECILYQEQGVGILWRRLPETITFHLKNNFWHYLHFLPVRVYKILEFGFVCSVNWVFLCYNSITPVSLEFCCLQSVIILARTTDRQWPMLGAAPPASCWVQEPCGM